MDFYAMVEQALILLRSRGRVPYRALKLQLQLDDDAIEALKDELIYAQHVAVDEDGKVLVWTGDTGATPAPDPTPRTSGPSDHQADMPADVTPRSVDTRLPEAERRQLTVLFCDLVDSTALASQLDPEDWRAVVRAYQDTCAKVIARFEGHIAQYLGDGLLVYFGYPQAPEDDAPRAVRAGLGMVEAIAQLNARLAQERGVQLAVRLGIHTGLVVVGEMGGGTHHEQLALGETPNLAARLQGIAAPDTLVISAAAMPLLGGFFACQSLGTPLLKGVAQPLEVYRVLYESMARSRLEAAGSTNLTPLVGREPEVALLRERWAQVKDGLGQVVLLSGEAGIGKSRLVQMLMEQVAAEPQAWLTPCQCSPYYQNTALYPLIELLERVALRFDRDEAPQQKLRKLEGFLVQYGLPLAEAVPLFAALLSIPLGADYASLDLSPEQQKQKTLHALLTILLKIAAQQPVLFVMEDLHWVDPTTLELLTLLVDQGPITSILALLTFRPDFSLPWTGRSHLTQVTLPRLPRRQAAEMTGWVAHGKALPPEVIEQVVAKTDGVPLFVEELTKMVLESGLLQEREARYELTGPLPPLAIPPTLQDSLMARLDRMAAVKGLAQLGATLGREFSYDLLQAAAPWDEGTLQRGLHQLVEAEFLYQRGLPPQATYVFKHALIQDAAYQSLLKSTRQQHHQRIAQMLESRFPETVETQPELVAHHYTEAGLSAQAIPYWQRAGTRALQRSANVEAIAHVQRGLELLSTLPDTPQRTQHELDLLTTLGPALLSTRGYAAPEVLQAYTRARELCQQVGETPEHFLVLYNLCIVYLARSEHQTAIELGEQCLQLAQRVQEETLLLMAHYVLGISWFCRGSSALACTHLERTIALYDPTQHHVLAYRYGGVDPGMACFGYDAWALWLRGYPVQARAQSAKALSLAQQLAHPYTLVRILYFDTLLCQLCRDEPAVRDQAEAAITVATAQRFALMQALGSIMRGWAKAVQEHSTEGLVQIRQGLDMYRSTGAEFQRPHFLTMLAEASGLLGQPEGGLAALDEALTMMEKTGEQYYEAELHRQRGELLLILGAKSHPDQGSREQHEAETCFQRALGVARQQQAKSLELRAAMSLSRLWQRQGKHQEAYDLLAPIYGWFTEGFDTADLQEAKALLEELS
jgi:TOMM system kinase/cyclase fusion protein